MTSRIWLCGRKKREGFQISGLDVWMDANVNGTSAYATITEGLSRQTASPHPSSSDTVVPVKVPRICIYNKFPDAIDTSF